jgi:putative SOS response-associated peptidase YedK
MCGRYTLTKAPDEEKVIEPEGIEIPLIPRYNIAPSQFCPIVPMDDPIHIHFFRWGLIPHWAREASVGYKMINARAETLTEKPAFRNLLGNRRCLVLADSFFEWKKAGSKKQPYRIMLKSGEVFAFAGLTSRWRDPADGQEIGTFTIITCEPNEVAALYHDRMPVILTRESARIWLDPKAELHDALSLLKPYPAAEMRAYPVSPAVGSPRNDSEDLVREWKGK